jgi:ribonuclease VapC
MDSYILDTFALMAYFQGEPSSDTIETLLAQALDQRVTLGLSVISAGELYYMTHRKRNAARANEV